jgi:hypothetical protein
MQAYLQALGPVYGGEGEAVLRGAAREVGRLCRLLVYYPILPNITLYPYGIQPIQPIFKPTIISLIL